MFFWLRWVFAAVCRLFPSCGEWGLLSGCSGFSLRGFSCRGAWALDHRLRWLCAQTQWPGACGIFPVQGASSGPLRWQIESNHWTTTEVLKWREVAQSCPTLCDPMDYSLPGSFVPGIFQARVLEWGAISFSRGIFLTQGSNLGLLQCRQMLYHLSHQSLIDLLFWKNFRFTEKSQRHYSQFSLPV